MRRTQLSPHCDEMAAARLTFRPLDLSDLNEVDELEIAAFKDPSYRCTRDKVRGDQL